MRQPITVLLVDDHAVVREGYRRLLEDSGRIVVIGEAATAAAAYQQFCQLAPRVVVMDIALPGASGIEAMRRILAREPGARILAFSMYEEAIFVRRAFEAGAVGYLTKASAPEVLLAAVEAVASGNRYVSSDVAHVLAASAPRTLGTGHESLSAREFEVLKLLVQGWSLSAIAEQLGVHAKTVANHQSSIKHKLGANSTAQLFHAAFRLGLLPAAPLPDSNERG